MIKATKSQALTQGLLRESILNAGNIHFLFEINFTEYISGIQHVVTQYTSLVKRHLVKQTLHSLRYSRVTHCCFHFIAKIR